MGEKLDKLVRQRPEAFDAADVPHRRELAGDYLLDVLPAHVHERLARDEERREARAAKRRAGAVTTASLVPARPASIHGTAEAGPPAAVTKAHTRSTAPGKKHHEALHPVRED